MRNPIPFDTHAFVKRLIAAGVPEAQAEANVENLADVVARLVTKDDLSRAVEQLEHRIEMSEQRIEQRLAQSELKITIRVGVIASAAVGLLMAFMRLYLVR